MIKELRGEYPVRLLCRVLAVSRSGFHAWLTREPSARSRARQRLKVAALAAHQRTRQTYGAERLRRELAADGFCQPRHGEECVARTGSALRAAQAAVPGADD